MHSALKKARHGLILQLIFVSGKFLSGIYINIYEIGMYEYMNIDI